MEKQNSGFTLAELLIVVAVIAVLVAISIPIFNAQLEKSRRAVDVDEARQIGSVLASFLNDETIQVGSTTEYQITVFVSRTKTDGGFYQDGKTGTMPPEFYRQSKIGGKTYSDAGGMKGVWKFLETYGISKELRMKQKSSDIDYYAVSVNRDGEMFYYEGKGNMNDYRTKAKKYSFEDVNTPIN